MSTAFTITASNWYSVAKLEELRLGYSERRKAIDMSYRKWNGSAWADGDGTSSDTLANNEPTTGFNIQLTAFFLEMQEFFDEYCSEIAFPYGESEPYDLENPPLDTGNLNLALGHETNPWLAFCKMVGTSSIYVSDTDYGWRKAASSDPESNNEPVFTRGVAEDGDILGSWLIEDLVLVMQKFTTIQLKETTSNTGTLFEYFDGSLELDDEYYEFGRWAEASSVDDVYSTPADDYGLVEFGEEVIYQIDDPTGKGYTALRLYVYRVDSGDAWTPSFVGLGGSIPDDGEMLGATLSSSAETVTVGWSARPGAVGTDEAAYTVVQWQIVATVDFTNI